MLARRLCGALNAGDIGHKRFSCPHKAHNPEGEGPSDEPQIVTESTPQQPEKTDINTEVRQVSEILCMMLRFQVVVMLLVREKFVVIQCRIKKCVMSKVKIWMICQKKLKRVVEMNDS